MIPFTRDDCAFKWKKSDIRGPGANAVRQWSYGSTIKLDDDKGSCNVFFIKNEGRTGDKGPLRPPVKFYKIQSETRTRISRFESRKSASQQKEIEKSNFYTHFSQ